MIAIPRARGRHALLAVFFGTTSLLTLGAAVPTAAQNAPPVRAPESVAEEEVLITGSLIHGATAVGVPVTALGVEDFKEAGALTIADLLRNVPAVYIQPSMSPSTIGGNQERTNSIDIHGLNGSGGLRTLMLINGMRFPQQKDNAAVYDPSIIPSLALERVDVLADGASATYGSDAVAGVVNVILRRNYDGAISQVRVGKMSGGGESYQASQLLGRTWEGGGVVFTFETYDNKGLNGNTRTYYTTDFTPWGLENLTPVRSAIPGIVSTGSPTATVGTSCTNCYSIPAGQNGVGLTWSTLLANKGVENAFNPYTIAQITPDMQRNAATLTFDHAIFPGIQIFADGFYSNRRSQILYPANISPYSSQTLMTTAAITTTNPYYPAGAPAGLRVSYNFSLELPPVSTAYEIAGRYAGGFNLDLPFDWNGKLFASVNQETNNFIQTNFPNVNAVNAALGNTVASLAGSGTTPGMAAYSKPANIPYLNVFCDPRAFQCNDPLAINYISSYANTHSNYIEHQYGANFDGPLFALPGGTVRAAVGTSYQDDNYSYVQPRTRASFASNIIQTLADYESRTVWAAFGQLNVPIVGEANTMPLINRLELEVSYRYDHYSDFGGTSNPKVAVDWMPTEDLKLRASWGTSFRAPLFKDISPVAARNVKPENMAAGDSVNGFAACKTVGETPAPGSVAAILNPTCSAALQFPGGLDIQGGANGLQGITRPLDYKLKPEEASNWNLGFDYAPSNFLAGLDISATWYKIHIKNTLVNFDDPPNGLNDPHVRFAYLVKGDPGFDEAVAKLATFTQTTFNPAFIANIKYIDDGAIRNAGTQDQQGIDFSVNYAWDMADWGAWNTGITGNYKLHNKTTTPGAEPFDVFDANGQAIDVRMRYRAQLGWAKDGIAVTGFVNYMSHIFSTEAFPTAVYLAQFPDYTNLQPAQYTFDLAVGYNTGERPESIYLKNLNFQFVANNILNRKPPFAYKTSAASTGISGYLAPFYSPNGAMLSFTVTKTW